MDRFIVKKPRLDSSGPPLLPAPPVSSMSTASSSSTPAPTPTSPAPLASSSPSSSCQSCPGAGEKTTRTGKGRSFQHSWLKSFEWITRDAYIDKVFCKICQEANSKGLLKFSKKREDNFIHVGFSNWKKALERFKAHENSETHKEGISKLASFSSPSVVIQLNEQQSSDMNKARSCLMAIFTSLKFLCRQGLAIRGHEELSSNFRQLLNLRQNDIPELKEWMGRTGYKWLSHETQNEIIELLAGAVLRSVVNEIKKCDYFAIMLDETTDVSVKEQVAVCIRTVSNSLDVNEDFIGLYETTNTKAVTLFEIVKDMLLRLGLPIDKLRGQCYDGASNMSGEFKGLQKLITDLQPLATYIHCAAHSLNLAVEDSLRNVSVMRDTMSLAKDLINTIRASPKRLNILKTINCDEKSDPTNLRPLCPTRWTMRSSSIRRIIKHYKNILMFLEKFSQEENSDSASKCSGFLDNMLLFKTFFFLSMFCHVMDPVEEVNTSIQCPKIGATEVESKLECLLEILEERRAEFDLFWDDCLHNTPEGVEEPKLPRQRFVPKKLEEHYSSKPHEFKTPKDYFRRIYIEIFDTVKSCVNERFQNTGLQKVLMVEKECVSAVNNRSVNADAIKLEKGKAFFANDINSDRLKLHLSMLGDIARQRNKELNSMHEIRKLMVDDGAIRELLPEVHKALKLLRVVPVTTATAERSFSALRRLKTYLRSTMGQKRLNNISVLNAHQSVLDDLDLRPIINDFIKANSVRSATFALFPD